MVLVFSKVLAPARSKSSILFVWLQLVVVAVKALEHFLAILSQVGPTNRCYCSSEEPWFPLRLGSLPFGSLRALLLLDLRLQIRCETILPAYYGIGDFVPELQRFVRQLLFERRHYLGDWVEWVEIDDEVLLLWGMLGLKLVWSTRADLLKPC